MLFLADTEKGVEMERTGVQEDTVVAPRNVRLQAKEAIGDSGYTRPFHSCINNRREEKVKTARGSGRPIQVPQSAKLWKEATSNVRVKTMLQSLFVSTEVPLNSSCQQLRKTVVGSSLSSLQVFFSKHYIIALFSKGKNKGMQDDSREAKYFRLCWSLCFVTPCEGVKGPGY